MCKQMSCPHCHQDLPDNAAARCPFCQQSLPLSPVAEKSRYWVVFWLAFLGAPASALLALTVHVGPELLFLPVVGALIAGFSLAKILSKDMATFVVTGILYSIGVAIFYVGVLFLGCVALMANR
jgi:hypothetical protein